MIDTTVKIGTSLTWNDVGTAFRNYNNTNRWPTFYDHDDNWSDPYHVRETLNRWISVGEYDKLTMISNGNDNTVTITKGKKKMVVENETQKIKKVIFSDPATIVLWEDGTKTVVKTQKGDQYDPEKGLAMACMRKILDKKDYHKWLEEARGKNTPINEEGRSKGV